MSLVLAGLTVLSSPDGSRAGATEAQLPAELAGPLRSAGPNRGSLLEAWRRLADAEHRQSLAFLLEHMPVCDLRTLRAEFLLENVRLAHEARQRTPWARAVPLALFHNDVLPHAVLGEPRDPWRRRLYERFAPRVADARNASEAAERLNRVLWQELGVVYSVERLRPDQSPGQTIETGRASCTGLSILLVAACRAVGVPARVATIAKWPHKPGNHTWVEVWDGRWRFAGAAEPDPQGLDRAWFVEELKLARRGELRHAVLVSSWRRTGLVLPVEWGGLRIPAIDETDRYAPPARR